MSALAIRFHRGGVFLPKLGLWLDPHDPKTGPERVFISHAHSDHIGLHREVILSKPTSKLIEERADMLAFIAHVFRLDLRPDMH